MTVNTNVVNAFKNKIQGLIGAKADSEDFTTIRVVVTYTDNTTEVRDLYVVPVSNNS